MSRSPWRWQNDVPSFVLLETRARRPLLSFFGTVVGKLGFSALVRFDRHLSGLQAVLRVPSFDGVLAGRHLVELERAVRARRLEEWVIAHHDEARHPGVHVTLELEDGGFARQAVLLDGGGTGGLSLIQHRLL